MILIHVIIILSSTTIQQGFHTQHDPSDSEAQGGTGHTLPLPGEGGSRLFTKSIHSIHENSIKNSKTIKIHESQVNFPGNGSSFWHVAKRGRKLPVPLRSVGSLVSWCDDETVKIQWEILMVFWTNPWFFRLIQKLIQKIQKLIQKVMKCPESL